MNEVDQVYHDKVIEVISAVLSGTHQLVPNAEYDAMVQIARSAVGMRDNGWELSAWALKVIAEWEAVK